MDGEGRSCQNFKLSLVVIFIMWESFIPFMLDFFSHFILLHFILGKKTESNDSLLISRASNVFVFMLL